MRDFLEASMLRAEFITKLDTYRAKNPPASMTKAGECCRSGVCCWRRPGALSKDDVGRMAAELKTDVPTLFRTFLVVDRMSNGLMIMPRRAHQTRLAGRFVPWRETYSLKSPCVFLQTDKGNACRVHAAKPTECSQFKCWDKTSNEIDGPTWTEAELKQTFDFELGEDDE